MTLEPIGDIGVLSPSFSSPPATAWSDDFSDGSYDGWTVESGSWEVNAHSDPNWNELNWLENMSYDNKDAIIRPHEGGVTGTYAVDHYHEPAFYGGHVDMWYADENNYVGIHMANANTNYKRRFQIVENGTKHVNMSLGTYDEGPHTYAVTYDGAGGWSVAIDGTEQITVSYEPSFTPTAMRFWGSEQGHRITNVSVTPPPGVDTTAPIVSNYTLTADTTGPIVSNYTLTV